MNNSLSLHDETILNELADGLARVGLAHLVGFVRVDPNATLAAFQHGRSQPLLGLETHHGCNLRCLIN